jgi:hypothetical protein
MQTELIAISDDKRKDLAGFILQWRWYFKNHNVRKGKIRACVADKFRKTPQYLDKTWTTDEFCLTWAWLEKEKRI